MLLFDGGNSQLKCAVAVAAELQRVCALPNDADDFAERLQQWLAEQAATHKAAMAAVGPQHVVAAVNQACQQVHGCAVQRFETDSHYAGLLNGYRDCSRMGVDRWLAMLGAWARYQHSCCVVDVGTAITVDWFDGKGRHQGGQILPGVALMQSGLRQRAAQIADVAGSTGEESWSLEQPWGLDTDECIPAAAHSAVVAYLQWIQRWFAQYSPATRLLLMGGGARDLLPELEQSWQQEEELVLAGLYFRATGKEIGAIRR